LVEAGELTRAADLAVQMADSDNDMAPFLYLTAVVHTHLADASGPAAEGYAAKAVELLERARAMQHFSAPSTRHLLQTDRELAPLRGRADFQRLRTTVEAPVRAGVDG
jgi:hypothetical protein